MNTLDKKNGINRDLKNQYSNDRNLDKDLYNLDETRKTDNDNREIAERGYTVRNGYNPNRPNPDQEDFADSDLDDLSDDFHTDRDLEDTSDAIYEVELEDEVDELDNPSDVRENEDFNETEDVLEDIDDEDEDEDEDDYVEEDIDETNDYIEDDVQEDNDDEEYPENDPRRF